MRRHDLLVGALAALAVLATAAWFGRGHAAVIHQTIPAPPIPYTKPFQLPDDPPIVDSEPSKPVHSGGKPALPDLHDPVAKPVPDQLTQEPQPVSPITPDHPVTDIKIGPPSDDPDNTLATRTYPLIELDENPVVVYQARPVYPTQLRDSGAAGTVLVSFIVDTNGAVRNATAVRSTNPAFEEAAVHAVSLWKFKPGRKLGVAVRARMEVPVVFSLDNN